MVTDDPRETGERWPNGGRVIRSASGFLGCDCENAPYCGHPDADHSEALFREIVGDAVPGAVDLAGLTLIHAVEMGPFRFEWWRSADGDVLIAERWKNGFVRLLQSVR